MNNVTNTNSTGSANTPMAPTALEKIFDRAAALARAEDMARLLRDHCVSDGFSPNDAVTERMLKFFRKEAMEKGSATEKEFDAVLDFCREHDQSLDWLICGDAGIMVYRAAKTSARAREIILRHKRDARKGRGPSQFDIYPLPFFDSNAPASTRCWTVAPTGNYAADCDTGATFAIQFLRSCDGTCGWQSLLANIVASMINARAVANGKSNEPPKSQGIVVGFMSVIGTALNLQNVTTDVADAIERSREKERIELTVLHAKRQNDKPRRNKPKRIS